MEKKWKFFEKTKAKVELPYSPANLLLAEYPKELKSVSKRQVCIPMFFAALFIVAKMWNQSVKELMSK
jgi:hypothetical protein